jgi:hypothetical protein
MAGPEVLFSSQRLIFPLFLENVRWKTFRLRLQTVVNWSTGGIVSAG